MAMSGGSQPQALLGGPSRCGRVLGPSLDKIIKNVAWRKHSHLVASCKSALDKLDSLSDSPTPDPASCSPLYGLSSPDADSLLSPILLAIDSGSPKVVEPALDCASRLFSLGLLRCCEIDRPPSDDSVASRLIDSAASNCGALRDEAIELALLRLLLSAVRSPCVLIRADCLNLIVRTCYNIYLGGLNGTNQICAKSVLAQMMIIIFTRLEEDSVSLVHFPTVSVADLLEFTDRSLNEGSSVLFVQNFINEVVQAKDSTVPASDLKHLLLLPNQNREGPPKNDGELGNGEPMDEEAGPDLNGYSKIREDGFMIFKNLCKLSMKFSSQEHQDDEILLRGKILSLELLKVIMENAGPIWRTNERTVNGLLKTALGPPLGSITTLSSVQDITFRHESVKCLVRIIKSVGDWMDQQLKIGEFSPSKTSDNENLTENQMSGEEVNLPDLELHSEANSEFSDAVTLEQRRAYKLELQKGVTLFNRKPSKGIEFLISSKKISGSPESVAFFLKNTAGLNETKIGDYLGEREEFSLKVMHAYVDSFNFEKMDFGEAIRFFLRGFRLPGEAQKIDRLMEKFAERYCKCNPNSFSSADTAYVLAYSVILLNTDAHNSMVKDKMSKADFIRNNRGINDGKDLPEEYLGALYDRIVKNEIKINVDSSVKQNKQANTLNKLLGLDGILNLVWKQTEEKPLGANGVLIRHIQEQFKEKSGKSDSVSYAVADVAILRFMVEVCWGPMLAAFSVTMDQSDDKAATSQCLQGFRHAVHVTSVMGMQTQRDAFVTSVAKFTYLHCAADMKQKNVDAVKAIISIAIEDGNHLQEAWEHVLTCLSRFEHLQLLGEGAPSDASFLTVSNNEVDEKSLKLASISSLKRKGALQNPAVMAVVRGGSYDSTTPGVNTQGLVTPEQITNFISNLNLLDQIGSFELNHIFAHSQRLSSEAIVAFVKALCKVSMSELQSPTDPRVFCLTKIVEVAHYNMNRIRLVWSRIWCVLSDFFVSVGLSENLSVAIFVMDSLRQLAMKFLEREELANYNFQNEFLRPFVIVMQKSNSPEIRELLVRCISQMVLSRVNNVKSGWKSVFLVLTAAAADERKNIVLLAFETMEKIVREYFPYITETETVTFTDCVRCLITFTSSRFNCDVSLNAIAFLRFCAVKLADGGLGCNEKNEIVDTYIPLTNNDTSDGEHVIHKDDHMSFWIPLLTGLSKLTSDPRSAIRKGALEVLFNILKDHGHLFSSPFWTSVFNSVIFPIYDKRETLGNDGQSSITSMSLFPDGTAWDSETSMVATQCLVDLFIHFYHLVRSQLPGVLSILTSFIRSSGQGAASTGVAALTQLIRELGGKLSEEEWRCIFLALKEATTSAVPGIMKLTRTMNSIEMKDIAQYYNDSEVLVGHGLSNYDSEDDNLQTATYVVSRMKSHIASQLLILQVMTDLYKMHKQSLSGSNLKFLLETFSSITSHAHILNSETTLQLKLQRACSILEMSEPPLVHFENEAYLNYMNFLNDLVINNLSGEMNIELELVSVCEQVLQIYLDCSESRSDKPKLLNKSVLHGILPLGSAKKEELAARTSMVVSVLQTLSELESNIFRRHVSRLFPLLVDLVRSEHSSGEVQHFLGNMFQSHIGPLVMKL